MPRFVRMRTPTDKGAGATLLRSCTWPTPDDTHALRYALGRAEWPQSARRCVPHAERGNDQSTDLEVRFYRQHEVARFAVEVAETFGAHGGVVALVEKVVAVEGQ